GKDAGVDHVLEVGELESEAVGHWESCCWWRRWQWRERLSTGTMPREKPADDPATPNFAGTHLRSGGDGAAAGRLRSRPRRSVDDRGRRGHRGQAHAGGTACSA